MDLIIKNVPDDAAVKDEILRNAEATVRNYLERTVRKYDEVKEVELAAAVEAFRADNKLNEIKLVGTPIEETL